MQQTTVEALSAPAAAFLVLFVPAQIMSTMIFMAMH